MDVSARERLGHDYARILRRYQQVRHQPDEEHDEDCEQRQPIRVLFRDTAVGRPERPGLTTDRRDRRTVSGRRRWRVR
jgi:hypothetical protein